MFSNDQLSVLLLNFFARYIGVISKTGIDSAMNTVCNCTRYNVSPELRAVPKNNVRNVPAHVGHAMNSPVTEPVPHKPLPVFLDNDIAGTAIATLNATRYETAICKRRFTGIICSPIFSGHVDDDFGHISYRITARRNECRRYIGIIMKRKCNIRLIYQGSRSH